MTELRGDYSWMRSYGPLPQQQAASNSTGAVYGLWQNTIVRWDAATCSNVPVTQAWVDEVCASLTEALKNIAYLTANPAVKVTVEAGWAGGKVPDLYVKPYEPDAKSEQDRMWAAHKQFVA
jgi:hypothetical protein